MLLPRRCEQPPHPRGLAAVAGRGTPVEKRGLAGREPTQGAVCQLADPAPGDGVLRDRVSGWLSSEGPAGPPGRCRARARGPRRHSHRRKTARGLAVSEAATLWNDVLRDRAHRGLPAPTLVVMDGAAGLTSRCVMSGRTSACNGARRTSGAIWKSTVPATPERSSSGTTPESSMPTTASRRGRPTMRASRSGQHCARPVARSLEDAALTLLFGLVAFGHIQLRRIDGHQHLPSFLANMRQQAA